MRLLCVLAGGPGHPSSRFRVLQHLDLLGSRGIEATTITAKASGPAALLDLARRARKADAVLIQKKLFSRLKLAALLGSAPVFFDMDDAYFAVSPDERERFGQSRAARRARARAARLRAVLRRCRRAIVGNRFLGDYAGRYAPGAELLPTGIDLRPFRADAVQAAWGRRLSRRDGARIGWIGSRPSLRFLPPLAPPLREIGRRFPGARLVQICNDFIDLPGVPCETRRWSAESEAEDLLDLDVGLMPLDESPFSQGKCGFKILQYHAAGLPVVCSPVGVNRDLVVEGRTGLLARTEEEWARQIGRLLEDAALARTLGDEGRRQAEERYEATLIGARLADILLSFERGS